MSKKLYGVLCLLVVLSSSIGASAPGDRLAAKDKLAIAAGYYQYYPFSCSENTRIQGRFQVEAGEDVEVYIFDKDGYENFRRRKPAKTWYNSGRVYVDKINVTVPPGTYYLVFSNLYSLFTNKLVAVDVHSQN